MRTAHKLLLCACAVVGLSAGVTLLVLPKPEPVLLACPDVTPIPETRWAQVSEPTQAQLNTWPIPPEATPIPSPRRAVRRSKPLIAAPVPVEQCAPDRLPSAPGGESGAASNEVPEPSSLSLVAVGLVAVGVLRRAKATT